ncbi:hypothetical protein FF36_02526 [Frankia torreyi]|uniref:Uncharacterized protein n=1 Tax=Frankia torreyi TaxID=1856 RepID=A0A0D8BFM9_9ACTN|nr:MULTISPECIES: hypothetical protein [Frankia]KJE23098.1 hypothetical protein FF36_02526 [Frankia torreyi]
MDGQPAWRFCDKCFGIFFNGDPDPKRKGHCPAGDAHHAQGFVFYLPHDVPDTVGQPGWRFCDKCFGLFFNGDPVNKGRCPAGDAHRAQGFLFVLPHDVPDTVGQPGWRFCDKCFGLFFNGDPAKKGRCPAGDAHHAQGFLFVLPHRPFPNPSTKLHWVGSYVEVDGSGFEPNQPVQIDYQFKTSTGGAAGDPQNVASGSTGTFSHQIHVYPDTSSALVRAIDLGSGEIVLNTLEN